MSLASLIATGTKVWLDGVEPDEIEKNRARGITGATSNPAIVSKIIGRGHFDGRSCLVEPRCGTPIGDEHDQFGRSQGGDRGETALPVGG